MKIIFVGDLNRLAGINFLFDGDSVGAVEIASPVKAAHV